MKPSRAHDPLDTLLALAVCGMLAVAVYELACWSVRYLG